MPEWLNGRTPRYQNLTRFNAKLMKTMSCPWRINSRWSCRLKILEKRHDYEKKGIKIPM